MTGSICKCDIDHPTLMDQLPILPTHAAHDQHASSLMDAANGAAGQEELTPGMRKLDLHRPGDCEPK